MPSGSRALATATPWRGLQPKLRSLLLDGLEVVDEHTEHVVDRGLAGRATPSHLSKTRAPDGHLSTPMGQDDRSTIDNGGDLGDGENSVMSLRNPREISGRRLERGCGRAVTAAMQAMASATMSHKHVRCLTSDGAGPCRGLRRRRGYPQEESPHYHQTEPIPLHTATSYP